MVAAPHLTYTSSLCGVPRSQQSHSSTTYPHCSTCEVESGFYTAHEALKEQIVPAVHLLKRLYPASPLYITGHSLGAAMAVLWCVRVCCGVD